MVSALKIILFLCIIIIPLRGPRRRKDDLHDSKTLSGFCVNERGHIEHMKDHNSAKSA